MTKDWDYGGAYKKYDMEGEIHLSHGIVKVHDIHEPTPRFMLDADCVFTDPPGGKGMLSSYYTKAGLRDRPDYVRFMNRLFEVIDEISPKILFVELFSGNFDDFMPYIRSRWDKIRIYDSHYYNDKKRKCCIVQCGDDTDRGYDGLDESTIIDRICRDVPFEVIGDPLMGQGLVGRCATAHNRRFVGTELNPKRLAVLVDSVGGRAA